jgi:hypothetical protein
MPPLGATPVKPRAAASSRNSRRPHGGEGRRKGGAQEQNKGGSHFPGGGFSPSFFRKSLNSPSGVLCSSSRRAFSRLRIVHAGGVAIGDHERVVAGFAGGRELHGLLEQRNGLGAAPLLVAQGAERAERFHKVRAQFERLLIARGGFGRALADLQDASRLVDRDGVGRVEGKLGFDFLKRARSSVSGACELFSKARANWKCRFNARGFLAMALRYSSAASAYWPWVSRISAESWLTRNEDGILLIKLPDGLVPGAHLQAGGFVEHVGVGWVVGAETARGYGGSFVQTAGGDAAAGQCQTHEPSQARRRPGVARSSLASTGSASAQRPVDACTRASSDAARGSPPRSDGLAEAALGGDVVAFVVGFETFHEEVALSGQAGRERRAAKTA